jgi:hypothetical protein
LRYFERWNPAAGALAGLGTGRPEAFCKQAVNFVVHSPYYAEWVCEELTGKKRKWIQPAEGLQGAAALALR